MTDLFSYLQDEPKEEKLTVKEDIVFSVHELTMKIKGLLEPGFCDIWVEGEISNYKKHSSGHHYFSLKDEKAVISCVMWRSTGDKLSFSPDNGQKVKVSGNITVFEAGGRYQIDVRKMQISGVGELQAMFEELKRKLNEEGLFDPSRKQKLPYYIRNVGVVTAETGAAFQDIRKVIRSRAPYINIHIYNSKVQGKGAENEIVLGIEYFNSNPHLAEVLIIGRGGGSLEDLWPFNEEVVARAIYKSAIPVISAVGHEIDFSISDFAADIRAATPSHAAELVSLNARDELYRIGQYESRLNSQILSYFIYQKEILKGIENSYSFKRPADIIKNYYMVLDNIEDNFNFYFSRRLDNEKVRIDNFDSMFKSLNPASVLNRGYAIVRDRKSSAIIPDAKKVGKDQALKIELRDGSVNVTSD
ncbi:MAG: exodeoxyribonuclease VII large subunit [Candidatus Delongbacteria bacterium]|nr:exodeoxyribonuclease VII large subunit [Candidatus Delongbacteria bacterium]